MCRRVQCSRVQCDTVSCYLVANIMLAGVCIITLLDEYYHLSSFHHLGFYCASNVDNSMNTSFMFLSRVRLLVSVPASVTVIIPLLQSRKLLFRSQAWWMAVAEGGPLQKSVNMSMKAAWTCLFIAGSKI